MNRFFKLSIDMLDDPRTKWVIARHRMKGFGALMYAMLQVSSYYPKPMDLDYILSHSRGWIRRDDFLEIISASGYFTLDDTGTKVSCRDSPYVRTSVQVPLQMPMQVPEQMPVQTPQQACDRVSCAPRDKDIDFKKYNFKKIKKDLSAGQLASVRALIDEGFSPDEASRITLHC